jgi:eukaryotic-like serine/threonine-protein kinase
MPTLPTLAPGDTYAGEYEVLEVFATEADRIVAAVRHVPSGRREALKIVLPADDSALEVFVAEMQRAAAVASKHILSLSAVGVDEANGCPYVVTEFLEGKDVATTVHEATSFPLESWDDIVSQIAQALGAGHAVGISHGHLTPEMVVLAPASSGDRFRSVLLDLGLPVAAWSRAKASTSRAAWTAPEVAAGGGPSAVADVWSFGMFAFYLITGKSYFPAANAATIDEKALAAEAKKGATESASARAKALGITDPLPRHFDAFFAKCTAQDPAARFATGEAAWEGASDLLSSVNDMAAEVTEAADGPDDPAEVVVAHKPPPLPLMKAIQQNPKPAVALAVVLALGAVGAGLGMGSVFGNAKTHTSKTRALEWANKSADECEAACNAGDASACHGLGLMTASGGKVPRDPEKAFQRFDQACKGGDLSGCASQAERYLSGEGTTENASEAVALYARACDGGEGGACADVADLYREGRGTAKDETKAKSYQEKACKAGVKESCAGAPQ